MNNRPLHHSMMSYLYSESSRSNVITRMFLRFMHKDNCVNFQDSVPGNDVISVLVRCFCALGLLRIIFEIDCLFVGPDGP